MKNGYREDPGGHDQKSKAFFLFKKCIYGAGNTVQLVEILPRMYEALGSTPRNIKNQVWWYTNSGGGCRMIRTSKLSPATWRVQFKSETHDNRSFKKRHNVIIIISNTSER